ncbi:MAG: hypothetical protein WD042_11500 [Phycisphaeraceae bacterium]
MIERVEVAAGKVIGKDWVWSGKLICVESLRITAHASDGRVFGSDVCMALLPETAREERNLGFPDTEVYVTWAARKRLSDTDLWYHLGGYNDDGDPWDTQQCDFARQLAAFWTQLMGPDEMQRQRLLEPTNDLTRNWCTITLGHTGQVTIHLKNGKKKVLVPPRQRGDAP